MKHKLLKLIPLWMLTGLFPSALGATDFNYTYEGQTITYTILSKDAKTVKTKDGWYHAGNEVKGPLLILPETVYYQDEPYTLTTIGEFAFENCTGLKRVTLPNSVTTIGENAFSGCSGLTSVTLPNSVTTIEYSAFWGCTGLTSITLPNSVTTIGSSAFAGCTGLTSVTLPNSVTTIGSSAFWGCTGLTHDVYNDKIFAYAERVSNRTNVEIPDGIEIIAGGAFYEFSGLTSVTLPNSVTNIGSSAFSGCTGLTGITLPNSVTTIGSSAFWGCTGLTSITLPNSVTTIGSSAFWGCTGLTSITLPNSVTTIGSSAFSGCTSLLSYAAIDEITQSTISGEVKIGDIKGNVEPAAQLGSTTMNGKFRFTDLSFATKYDINYGFTCNGTFCQIKSENITTQSVSVQLLGNSITATSAVLVPSVNSGDANVTEEYWDEIEGQPGGHVEVAGLNPNESYTFTYVVKGESGKNVEKSVTVKTKELELTTQPGQAMNMTTALLSAKTNISELEEKVGFEWRRYDAPATLPSQKVMCAVVDGMLMGALSNLNPDVYYNYRPFYTSNSGNTYYGDWVTIFTGDANVYFDPTVRTYTSTNVGENGATIRGYALRGSDDIKRQGFQYWSEATSRAATDITEVEVSGTRLTYSLNGLKPGTTYSYRVFVETAGGTTYGDTVSFTTKGEESGIDEVEATTSEEATVTGYWNIQGVRSDRPYRGLNIVRYTDGTVRKEVRL